LAQKAEDLRVRRTRKLLQRAFIELTIEKGFADVTVRDIAERAMVNRSTFYRHYLDKYDLLSQYIEGLSELIDSHEEDASPMGILDQHPDSPPAGLVNLLKDDAGQERGSGILCAEFPTIHRKRFPPHVAQRSRAARSQRATD